MYGFLWRVFPGGLVGKLLCSLLLAAAAVVALFLFVFPQVERLLPFQDVTVDSGTSTPAGG
ncbi:MAG: hypothetical protein LC789_13145 [Actinobacteria bacterium]|nr:hypothetical protein [Actinomycetota bacterium]MCA1722001.1 hypothetical protein [Actinomycetota bacterium]